MQRAGHADVGGGPDGDVGGGRRLDLEKARLATLVGAIEIAPGAVLGDPGRVGDAGCVAASLLFPKRVATHPRSSMIPSGPSRSQRRLP